MGERTEHRHGTFSWTDLTTTDQPAAKAFYSGLFGWEAEDMPAGEGVVYSMMRLDGRYVGAISPQPQFMADAGAPPAWNSYVTVDDADAIADRAQQLGGATEGPPFDVFDAGRMAVLRDPQGAHVFAWQPRRHIGAELVNVPGALAWNELATSDLDAATAFYGELFGWSITPFEGSPQPFSIRNGDANNGGIRELDQPGMPPHWLVYFGADDVAATSGRVQELGGTILVPPLEIPMGAMAVAQDPQGAVFALFAGEFEP
jgi:predicted enzyme related to lactoylglutathione lyase